MINFHHILHSVPPVPLLNVVPINPWTFTFNITSIFDRKYCIHDYILSTSSSIGGVFNITITKGFMVDIVPTTIETRGGFDLCRTGYNFTVVGVTSVGEYGGTSEVFNLRQPNFVGKFLLGLIVY